MKFTTTGSFFKDLRMGFKLMTSKETIVFQGPYSDIVYFEGEHFRLRTKTAARIKRIRTQNDRPWTTVL